MMANNINLVLVMLSTTPTADHMLSAYARWPLVMDLMLSTEQECSHKYTSRGGWILYVTHCEKRDHLGLCVYRM